MSCERTRAVLDRKKAEISEERAARKAPLTDKEVKALLGEVERVVVAKGKAFRELDASDATLDDLRGPTGNFRAPMVRKGKTLLVGFHEATLGSLLG